MPGEVSRIFSTAANPQNRPLTFSYMASAGSISGSGGTAVFSAAGAPPGPVEITCRVSDDQGRTAEGHVTVLIRASGMAVPPPPPRPGYRPAFPTALPPPVEARPVPPVHAPPPSATVPQPRAEAAPPPQPPIPRSRSIESASVPASGEYSEGYALEAWKKGLQQGQIEYAVPPKMKAQVPASISVKIHGFQDVAGAQPLLGATGSGSLPVSSYMKVEVLAPLNPGEFTITPQDSDAIQFVPNDGSATWNWVVTPAYEASGQKLEIRVSLVYKRPETTLDDLLVDQSYTVNVEVQKLTTTAWQDFQKDPVAFFKYVLPGGAGWAALAGLVTSLGGFAWWKRKKKPAHRSPAK